MRAGLASGLLRTCRLPQWVKNLLVVAAPLMAGELDDPGVMARTAAAFVVFGVAASGVYCVNDARDVASDRAHPTKRDRPVAAGTVPVPVAYAAGATLLTLAVAGAAVVSVDLVAVMATYVVLSLLYCFALKDQPVLDIAVVASGFLLRAIAGGAASGIELSRWFLLAASFGSLFMASGKRYAESLHPDGPAFRHGLVRYTSTYLRFVWTLSAGVLIMTYGLWAFELRDANGSELPVLSMAPFVLAVLRYAVEVDAGTGGEPEQIALRNRPLQLMSLVWLVVVALAVY